MNKKYSNEEAPTNSVIEVVEEGDVRRVFAAGKELHVSDWDSDDYSCFDVRKSDLKKIRGSDLPGSLLFIVEHKFSNKKFQLADMTYFSKSDQPEFVIEMLIYNKFWEGFFELTSFLEALIEQVSYVDNFNVIQSDLEDPYKKVVVRCRIPAEDLLFDSMNSAAEQFDQLIIQAEIALVKQGIERYLKQD